MTGCCDRTRADGSISSVISPPAHFLRCEMTFSSGSDLLEPVTRNSEHLDEEEEEEKARVERSQQRAGQNQRRGSTTSSRMLLHIARN
jgi:hypothetical protein